MRERLKAVGLADLVAGTTIAALLVSLAATTTGRSRELSKRMVCSMNLKSIGASAKIYAVAHNGKWMTPAFKRAEIDVNGIDYLNDTEYVHASQYYPGGVGYDRRYESTSEVAAYPYAGSVSVPTTRAFWMLVRSGDAHVKQYICPSSTDKVDGTEEIDLYYDFEGYENISYGYQVPFGPRLVQPHEGADPGRVNAADKGPFYARLDHVSWEVEGRPLEVESTPGAWRRFNSPNHGTMRDGEGQNCLYADGAVRFHRKPVVGVDHDNIYTLMLDDWDGERGRIYGEIPQLYPVPPYPGQDAFGVGPGNYSSTDSLIYP